METLALVLAIVAILIAIYYYFLKNENIFKKYEIPYIPPKPVLGNFGPLVFRRASMPDLLKDLYYMNPEAKYVGVYEFNRQVILIRDIDLIKSITMKNFEIFPDHRPFTDGDLDPLFGNMLFTLKGEEWKDTRSIVSPTFTSSKIKGMFPLMLDCAEDFAKYLSKLPEKEREMELKAMVSKYTNDVIASCAFGINVDSKKDPNNVFYVYGRTAMNFTTTKVALKFMLYRNMPWIAKALRIRLIDKNIADFFQNLILSAVKARDEEGVSRTDMIQLLMETRNKRESGKQLTPLDIATHAFTFFFGGFDTVSSQVSLLLYQLAANPEVQDRLQKEIDEVLENTQGQVTYDAITRMEYLDAVINEGMRISPVAPFLDRICVKRFELPPALPGGKPMTIEPGMNLWFPVYSIQHDPDYFEDPEVFKPERFLVDSKRIMNSGTFFPFGIGPRICIGNRFALIKMKVLVFYTLARCNILPSPKAPPPLEHAKGIMGVVAKNGLWVNVVPRKDSHPLIDRPAASGVPTTAA